MSKKFFNMFGGYTGDGDEGSSTPLEDIPPSLRQAARLTGTAEVGSTLTVIPASYRGRPTPVVRYRYQLLDGETVVSTHNISNMTINITEDMVNLSILVQSQAENALGETLWDDGALTDLIPEPDEEEIPDPDPDPEPTEYPTRTASNINTFSIHSGHSLTDSYVHVGEWPGSMRRLALGDGLITEEDQIIKSTIPGSPLHYRWDNSVVLSGLDADAKLNINLFDSLIITESGPPPRTTQESIFDTCDYACRFAANQIENGKGDDFIIWSIWPSLNGPPGQGWSQFTFRQALPEYTKSFKFIADYVTYKMHDYYPQLSEDWRAWFIPGSEWMIRVYDDIQNGLVPDITDIQQLFTDDIHPNAICGYGLSIFVLEALYNHEFSETSYRPANVSVALAAYFRQISSEILSSFGPAGLGGEDGWELQFDPATMTDGLPDWIFDYDWSNPDPDPDPDPVETVPAAPALDFGLITENSITVNTYLPDDGGSPLTGRLLEWYQGETIVDSISGLPETQTVVENLDPYTEYNFRVRFSNAIGDGPWSPLLMARTAEAEDPDPQEPEVNLPSDVVVYFSPSEGYNGPTLTPALPALTLSDRTPWIEGGYSFNHNFTDEVYIAAIVELVDRPSGGGAQFVPATATHLEEIMPWDNSPMMLLNAWFSPLQAFSRYSDTVTIGTGNQWQDFPSSKLCESIFSEDNIEIVYENATNTLSDPFAMPTNMTHGNIFASADSSNTDFNIRIRAMVIMDRIPTSAERSQIQEWLNTYKV